MKVGTKLYLGFGVIVAIALIVQAIMVFNLFQVRETLDSFDQRESRLLQLANDIRYYDSVLTGSVRAILLEPNNASFRTLHDTTAVSLDETIREAESLVTSDEDKQLFQNLNSVNAELIGIETT